MTWFPLTDYLLWVNLKKDIPFIGITDMIYEIVFNLMEKDNDR